MRSRLAPWASAAAFAPLALAAATLLVARVGGAYALSTRTALGTLVWAALGAAAVAGFAPRARPVAPTKWIIAMLLALAAWTALSAVWDASAENAIDEALRVLLYAGALIGVALLVANARRGRWSDGLGWGVAAVAVVALASRLFPALFPGAHALTFLSGVQTRLSYPVGYWTGLGVLMGMGFPLLIRAAVEARGVVAKAGTIAAATVLLPVLYLTSARLGFIAGAIGFAVYFAGSQRRFAVVGATAAAVSGGVLASLAVAHYPELVNGPLRGARASSDGRIAALEVLACLVETAVVYAWLSTLAPSPPRISRSVARTALGVAVVVAAIAVVLAHPVRRFDALRANPADTTSLPVQQHLLSGSSNGRWQLWHAALDEFAAHPWLGHGAGSFEAYWAQHGTIAFFTQNAHSLFLEAFAELGPVGGILTAAVFALALLAGTRRVRRTAGADREVSAALLGALVAYVLSAATDWMWQLTVVTLIAFVAIAVLLAESPAAAPRRARPRSFRALFAGLALVAVVPQALVYLAERSLDASRSAAASQQLQRAATDASAARTLEPWAASPYVQLALVAESARHYARAQSLLREAIARDTDDADLYLIQARLAAERGDIDAAIRAHAAAQRLSPNSPLTGAG